jgi:hypothetical protein
MHTQLGLSLMHAHSLKVGHISSLHDVTHAAHAAPGMYVYICFSGPTRCPATATCCRTLLPLASECTLLTHDSGALVSCMRLHFKELDPLGLHLLSARYSF